MSAAAVAATRAAYKNMKAKRLKEGTDGAAGEAWIQDFESASRKVGFAPEETEDDTLTPKARARASSMVLYEDRDTDWYARLAFFVNFKIVRRPWFERFITACILLVGIATGVDVTFVHAATTPLWAKLVGDITSNVTLGVFTIECVLKVVAFGRKPKMYFTDKLDGHYNTFDFLIVVLSYAFLSSDSGGTIAVMRLLRLVRVMNLFEALRVIIKGLVVGLRSVSSILMLLTLVIYMFAVVGVTLFGRNDPAHFATIPVAMCTLFRCATLASWKNIYNINYYGCDVFNGGLYSIDRTLKAYATFTAGGSTWPDWVCYAPVASPVTSVVFFFLYSLLTAFVIISLFIGVITMGMLEALEEQRATTSAAKYASKLAANSMLESGDAQGNSVIRVKLDQAFGRTGERHDTDRCAPWYLDLSDRAVALARTTSFNGLVVGAILVIAVSVGVQTDYERSSVLLSKVDLAVQIIFTAECVVKIIAFGDHPKRYFDDSWNIFDFSIVIVGWFESVLPFNASILRLVKLLRVFKLARSFPSLRIIVEALLDALSGVSYILIMIVTLNFIFASMGVIFFGANDPEHFDGLQRAMMTVWLCETLDGWEDTLYVNMYGCNRYGYTDLQGYATTGASCPGASATSAEHTTAALSLVNATVFANASVLGNATSLGDVVPATDLGLGWLAFLYFFVLVVFGAFVLPTVLVGVISISFEQSTTKVKEDVKVDHQVSKVLETCKPWYPGVDLAGRAATLREVFALLDCDGEGALDVDELKPFMTFFLTHYIGMTGIDYEHIEAMFYALDVDNSASIDFAEFLWFMFSCKQFLPICVGEAPSSASGSASPPAPANGSDVTTPKTRAKYSFFRNSEGRSSIFGAKISLKKSNTGSERIDVAEMNTASTPSTSSGHVVSGDELVAAYSPTAKTPRQQGFSDTINEVSSQLKVLEREVNDDRARLLAKEAKIRELRTALRRTNRLPTIPTQQDGKSESSQDLVSLFPKNPMNTPVNRGGHKSSAVMPAEFVPDTASVLMSAADALDDGDV